MKDIHLMFNELTERYRNYHEIVASFVRINTTNISEIQEIYQKFKSISSEINVFPSGLIPCIFNAYKYNNRYLKSYYLIFKMFYDEFQIKFDSPEHQALSYFLNKEYGFPIGYRDQKLFGNYSLDLHEKNTIYRSIMDDDKDSFIVFIESESFDKEQKLKHHFYPESSEGYSFLELCCYHGAVDCFKLLRTKLKSEITPQCLQFSFLSGKPEILNECLKFQKPDQECMKYAIISFNIDFITFLNREHGLDIDLETCRLWMNFQAFFVHLDISKDIDNCFVYCANFGPSVLEYFISNGCNINAKENKFKQTALHIAVTTGNKELIELLLYNGANVHSKDSYGEKSLSYAVGLHYNKIVETLIKFGADYTSKDIIGAALFAAARSNNYDVAEFLILNGANVNIKREGDSPLIIAAINNSVETAKLLISYGANVNEQTPDGQTVLCWSSKNNSIDITKLLISNGANANIPTKKGQTPLMFALHNKCLEIAELLLSSGADINAVQENGYSALHLAVGVNDLDTIKFLVYHHANINLRDYDGLTAYFHACDLGYNDIKLFFEQNGAM